MRFRAIDELGIDRKSHKVGLNQYNISDISCAMGTFQIEIILHRTVGVLQ